MQVILNKILETSLVQNLHSTDEETAWDCDLPKVTQLVRVCKLRLLNIQPAGGTL